VGSEPPIGNHEFFEPICAFASCMYLVQNCLVLSAVVFIAPTWTRQDKTVLSCPCDRVGGVNKLLQLLFHMASENLTEPFPLHITS